MKTVTFLLMMVAGLQATSNATADGDPKRGGELYRACVACHALEPDLHLSGPSLGKIWGRAAGDARGYMRYSPGLEDAGFEWNDAALNGWLADPAGMIPDTYMAFPGIEDSQARADLIAFLEIAGAPGGGKRAVAEGLVPESYLRAQAPEPIRDAPPSARIAQIRHCGDSYFIKTEDGNESSHWEKNVRLKIDSADTGPRPNVAVLLRAGMRGDRFSVIFSSLADLTSLVREAC